MKNAFKKKAAVAVNPAAPTGLLWSIANGRPSSKEYLIDDVLKMTDAMYPGINFQWRQFANVSNGIIRPCIERLFPQLIGISETAAVKKFGDTMALPVVKACKGSAWMNQDWQIKALQKSLLIQT